MSLIRRYIDKFSSITLETDPVSLRCIFDLTKFLYDSIDMYNVNYTKNISELIISFISRIDFGVNVEQQLNLYIYYIFFKYVLLYIYIDILTVVLVIFS